MSLHERLEEAEKALWCGVIVVWWCSETIDMRLVNERWLRRRGDMQLSAAVTCDNAEIRGRRGVGKISAGSCCAFVFVREMRDIGCCGSTGEMTVLLRWRGRGRSRWMVCAVSIWVSAEALSLAIEMPLTRFDMQPGQSRQIQMHKHTVGSW